jgi:hypothetical protein
VRSHQDHEFAGTSIMFCKPRTPDYLLPGLVTRTGSPLPLKCILGTGPETKSKTASRFYNLLFCMFFFLAQSRLLPMRPMSSVFGGPSRKH